MSWCTVKYCEINKKKNHKDSNVRFHRFPKNPVFENKWILACGKSNVNAKSARICSTHFEDDSYVKPLIEKLLEYSPRHKRKLKQDAIPTINVHGPNQKIKNLDFKVQSDTEICDDNLKDPKLTEIGTLLDSEINKDQDILDDSGYNCGLNSSNINNVSVTKNDDIENIEIIPSEIMTKYNEAEKEISRYNVYY
ncbi:uncharacterized protein LOC111036470 [Myzus persicae]|uniref:uncharacterized protein LOC111036470 n=1 Tax=Myzus persicae TaxID=13164 RepID=UPI000B937273|nr:uncharacterized protein LOC111036470 [Myzus persicae]